MASLYIIGAVLMAHQPLPDRQERASSSRQEAQAVPSEREPPESSHGHRHRWLEGQAAVCSPCSTIVAILIGGLIEIVPLYLIKKNVPTIASVKPYTPLEVLGRDIYIREGCVGCHSQMVRPFRSETERYGEYSKAGEYRLRPSVPLGLEAHRPGPAPRRRQVSAMPGTTTTWTTRAPRRPARSCRATPWLLTQKLDTTSLPARIRALRKIGVPYPAGYENGPAKKELDEQAAKVVANLKVGMVETHDRTAKSSP